MKVYLAAAVPFDLGMTAIPEFQALAAVDRFGVHQLTDDPAAADLILFVDPHQHPDDWRLLAIRNHPLTRRYPHKTLVYDERDIPWCALSGIYVSMPQSSFDARWQRACTYHRAMNELVGFSSNAAPELLFSFLGGRTHRLRERILELSHPRGHVEDSKVNFFDFSDVAEHKKKLETQKHKFAALMNRSKFILCPRGAGTSSIRLFETLAAGRVPVIISDEWMAPVGPDWDSCSIRVREADVGGIVARLQGEEKKFEEMSQHARQSYHEWFAPDTVFHRLMESCRELLQNGQVPKPKSAYVFDREYLKQSLRRGTAGNNLRRVKKRMKKSQ